MFSSKVFCYLYFIALIPYMCWAMSDAQKEQIHEIFEKAGTECIADNAVTADDIESLRGNKIPAGDNAPCFIACMFKKVGVLNENGMLEKTAALDLAKSVFIDEEEFKAVQDYLRSCASVNSEAVSDGEKGCDRAFLAYKCLMENASKFDFRV